MSVLAYAETAQEVSTDLGLLQRDSAHWSWWVTFSLSPLREGHYKLNKENGTALQQYPEEYV